LLLQNNIFIVIYQFEKYLDEEVKSGLMDDYQPG